MEIILSWLVIRLKIYNYFSILVIKKQTLVCFLLCCIWITPSFAEDRIIDLCIDYKTVNFTGKSVKAIAINDQIPGPTLHFKQGDHVTINVHNHLNKGTTLHWHGVLVPWQMDGVENVNQRAIRPGETFQYKFTLNQSGTYWYHAHTETEEQDGLYGAFIIDPKNPPHYKYTKDYVIVLSDWDNAKGEKIFANLKKDGDYYSPRFPLQASFQKFMQEYRNADHEERKKIIDDYIMMQKMRMNLYDLSDVAYDTYLLNGRPCFSPWVAPVAVGDSVRLRFIGAAGSTIYRVKINNARMQLIHVQGNDVEPLYIDDFSIAPGETYDVLVKIIKNKPYIIYAESIDTRGKAYGALVPNVKDSKYVEDFKDVKQCIFYHDVSPFPKPPHVNRTMHENMMASRMNHNSSIHGKHIHGNDIHGNNKKKSSHSMNKDVISESTQLGDTICCGTSSEKITHGTKYKKLKAAVVTNDPNKPVFETIKMELFGYMGQFIWLINGLQEHSAKPILIEQGMRYRIVFTNNSMMRHPMHIHGHWFIFRKGLGAHDPLLHTIEVAPGETIVADIDADASGQWFFHCHHLYHMMAGMSRVFQYNTIIEIMERQRKPQNYIAQQKYYNRSIVRVDESRPIDPCLVHHPLGHSPRFYFATYLDVGEDPVHNVQKWNFKGLYGGDYHKLELFTDDAEIKKGKVETADMDIFYWHLISQFWAVKGGVNYFYRPAEKPYLQPGIGVEGLMPYFINTNIRSYYHRSSVKLDVELTRDSQMTNNFFIRTGIRSILASKTVIQDEIGSGLNQMRYTIRPYYRIGLSINIFVEYEHEQYYGAFKRILKNHGEGSKEDTLTFGIAVLF